MSFSTNTGMTPPKANISGYKSRSVPNMTPQQMQIMSKIFGGLEGGLGGGLDFLSKLASGDEEMFQQTEAPAYAAFDKLLGQLGSRFAGMGALDSSAFQNATSGAAGELSQNLQANRMGLQQGAIDKLLGLSDSFLGQRPYDTFLEKNEGFDWGGLLGGLLGSFGGPALGTMGKGLGSFANKKLFG